MLCNHAGHSSLDLHSYDWPFMQKIKSHNRWSQRPNETLDSFSMLPFIKPLQWNLAAVPPVRALWATWHYVWGTAFHDCSRLHRPAARMASSLFALIHADVRGALSKKKKKKICLRRWGKKWVIRPQCCCSVRSGLWEAAAMHASQPSALICGEMIML